MGAGVCEGCDGWEVLDLDVDFFGLGRWAVAIGRPFGRRPGWADEVGSWTYKVSNTLASSGNSLKPSSSSAGFDILTFYRQAVYFEETLESRQMSCVWMRPACFRQMIKCGKVQQQSDGVRFSKSSKRKGNGFTSRLRSGNGGVRRTSITFVESSLPIATSLNNRSEVGESLTIGLGGRRVTGR